MAIEGEAPEWLAAGSLIVHSTFGTGTVGRVGDYKGAPTVWIDFDCGERKALSVEFGLPHLGRRKRWARRTPARPDLRCDVCGQRPVVLNVHSQMLCEVHKANFQV